MHYRLALVAGLIAATAAVADPVPARFDVLHNPDLYRQDTAKAALQSILAAIERDRHDYLAAHLLDPAFVDARLQTTQAYYEKLAAEQIAATAAGARLTAAELPARVRETATRLNFQHLAAAIQKKLADDPEDVKWLKRFARNGEFNDSGETATATLKGVKDRALYFKKVDGRWFMENRKDEAKPAKE